jgi:hypothetical protein
VNPSFPRILGAALFAAATATLAQQPAARLEYRSAFEDYRPHGETDLKDWRSANDTVRDVGGWRTYAREAADADPAAAPPPDAAPAAAQPARPASGPHEGHHP